MNKGQKIERRNFISYIKNIFFIIFCIGLIFLFVKRIVDGNNSKFDIFIMIALIIFILFALIFAILSFINESIYIYDDYFEYYDSFNHCEKIYYKDIRTYETVTRGGGRGPKYPVLIIKMYDDKKIEINVLEYKLQPLFNKIKEFKS